MVLTPLIRGLPGIDVDAPHRHVTIAPHLPPEWDSVAVENVPIGVEQLWFVVRRIGGAVTLAVRHFGPHGAPIDIEFARALPLGATVDGNSAILTRTPGDVHASVHAPLTDSADLRIAFDGGWFTMPPKSATDVGSRSSAPRVVSERLASAAGGVYAVALVGLAGRSYTFLIGAPSQQSARQLVARVSNGATVQVEPMSDAGRIRRIAIIFPVTDQNADGYSASTVSFTTGVP